MTTQTTPVNLKFHSAACQVGARLVKMYEEDLEDLTDLVGLPTLTRRVWDNT